MVGIKLRFQETKKCLRASGDDVRMMKQVDEW